MIKSIFGIITIIIFYCNIVNCQVTLMQQNFENGGSIPTGWTNEYVSYNIDWIGSTGGYSSNPATAHGGTYNAMFYSDYKGDKTKLVTSVINLSGYINCQLSFWHAQVNWLGDQDSLKVYYKTSLGGSWTLLATYNTETPSWTLRTLSLPSTNSTYYIAFEGHAEWGYGVCIDDVTVTGTLPPSGPDIILINSANNGSTFNTCNAEVYDNGGESGDYTNNNNYTITIASTNGSCVRAILQFYNIEYNWDFLYFYDGPNTTYPQIGDRVDAYPGYPYTTLNSNGNAYYALSGYLTIKFTSDGTTVAPGFKIKVDCPENCTAPACAGSQPAGEFCNTSTAICDLTGYCGNTSTAYDTDHEEIETSSTGLNIFCGGINNNSWLSFVADSSTAILDVWVKNCQGSTMYEGNPILGIQLEVFSTDCSYGNFTPVSNCWSPSEQINGQIVANGLTVGDTYLIMIDGYAKDNCEYTFSASAGVNVANAGTDKTICEGEYASITASGGTNVLWSASPSDPSLSGQESNMSITVSPGQTTTYTAEVWGSNALCSDPADVVVFVNSAEAEFTGLDNAYCSDASAVSLSGNFASGVFSGTGISGSTFNPSSAIPGNTNVTYTYNYSVVTVFSDDFDPSPNGTWITSSASHSWIWGKPKGGRGSSSAGYADPLVDHSTGNDNYVYGQGLGSGSGDGVGGNIDNATEWVRTPVINCTGLTNTTLSFWRWANLESGYDKAYIRISTNGTTWTPLPGVPLYPQDDHWVQVIIPISQFADNQSTVYIRWESISDGNTTYSGWNIDDVVITGVQSGGSCVSTDIQTTYVNPVLSATIAAGTAISCYGASNATATVTPSGGTSPYTYIWSNGQTTATATGLSVGTHYVTINDSYGVCASVIKSISISQPSKININPSSIDASCGSNNGSASASVSGGTSPLSIIWSTGSTSNNITNQTAGIYGITVTDSNGCTKDTSVQINSSGAPSASISSTNVNCYGASTGSATVSVTNGSGSYSYAWTGGATTATISNLTSGTYSVTVTDGSCTAPASVTITQPVAPLTVTVSSQTNVLCFGNSTGSATVSVTGGTTAYSYLWSVGGTTASKTNLAAGTYTVTVSDSKFCTATQTVTITQPASALTVSISTGNIACNNGTTTATATVSGGTSGYLYLWSSNTGFQTISTATNLIAGNYSVSIQDANSCTTTSSVTITQPTAISVASTVTITDAECYGQNNGEIGISPIGGTTPYTYNWIGPSSYSATTEDISGIVAGNYNLTLTDANNCKSYNGFTVSQPDQLSVILTGSSVSCSGGSTDINSNVSGGTSPYTYLWAGGQTSSSLTNVSSGTYTLTVTDFNNCKSNSSITITQPTPLTVSLSNNGISCYGGKTNITTTVSGGNSPYSYVWNGGQITSSLTNITAGTYYVTVTDNSSCTETSSITITQPTIATISYTSSNVICFGESNGSINITVSGGTVGTGYIYNWSNGSNIEDQNNLIAGTYDITVIDANSCNYDTTINISQPSQLTANVTGNNVTCNGGTTSATVSVSGGTNPYYYAWSNNQYSSTINNITAGTYTVTVTDGNNCTKSSGITITEPSAIVISPTINNSSCGNSDGSASVTISGGSGSYNYLWSNGGTTSSISSLSSGTYGITVTDNANCTKDTTLAINDVGGPSASISNPTHVTCNGNSNGTATVTVSGGTTPYTFNWSNGINNDSITNVAGAVYTVTVTDFNGCKANAAVTINEPAALQVTSTPYNSTCNGSNNGRIDINVTGGTTPYTFIWTNTSTNEDITGLAPNNYTVTITDSKGCWITKSETTSEPNPIVINNSSNNVSCNGLSDGSINLTINGGTSPYTYFWSNGQTTEDLSGLNYGTYAVTVTDTLNCKSNSSITITQPIALSFTSTATNVSCFGGSDGSINLSVSGGTTPYAYSWDNGQTSSSNLNLISGVYIATITDQNNCNTNAFFTITQPAILTTTISPTDITCNGLTNGSINITVSGGTTPYSYSWSNGFNSQNISNLDVGSYTVTVTDNKLCTSIVSSNITQPNALTNSNTSENVSCYGKSDGSIDLSVNGGTTPYTYIWSNGETTQDLSSISANAYSVTIYDANDCMSNLSVTVSQPNSITYSVAKTNITCYGYSNGAIDLTVSGGTSPFGYIWSNNETTQDIADIASGSYSVTVTDANNCDLTASVSISEPAQIVTSIVGNDVTCNGLSNGSINLTVSGGLMPYYYSWNYGQLSQDLFNIDGGTYEVTITDSYNCSKIESYTIYEPGAIILSSTSTNVKCYQGNDGTANISVVGGMPTYTYTWSNGYAGSNVTKLPAGTFTVTVTDSNGCEAITSVTVTEPTILATFISTSNVSCKGFANGNAIASTVGGTIPYNYLWSNGSTQFELYSLTPNIYSVTITDNNNCKITDTVTITEPNAVLAVAINDYTDVICFGKSNGYAIADVTGGTQPYTYNWSDSKNQKDSLANNLLPGTYLVTVTDANSCTDTIAKVTIAEAGEIKYNYISNQTSCNGSKDGSISVSVSGKEKPYSFIWNTEPVKKDSILKDLAYGTYIVTITDKYNCSVSDTITVYKPDNTCLEIPTCFTPNSDGVNDKFEIKYSELYPNIHVEIYNRWGILMFKSDGYLEMWDGTYNGKEPAIASYIYIINLGDGSETLTGSVSIVK